jgi:hypothetical protein
MGGGFHCVKWILSVGKNVVIFVSQLGGVPKDGRVRYPAKKHETKKAKGGDT